MCKPYEHLTVVISSEFDARRRVGRPFNSRQAIPALASPIGGGWPSSVGLGLIADRRIIEPILGSTLGKKWLNSYATRYEGSA